MPTREIRVRKDSRLFLELCNDLLRRGHQVQFRASGASMQPNLLDGDDVTVAPVSGADLRAGDVAFLQSSDGIRLHRVKRAASQIITTQGDAGLEPDPRSAQFFGRATSFSRRGTEYPLNLLRNRFFAPLAILSRRLRLATTHRLRSLFAFLLGAAAVFLLAAPSAHAQTADLQLTQTASSSAVDTNASTQSLGTASTVTWAGGVASFTFPAPLPSGVFPNALLTTTGFSPSSYNLSNAPITTVNYATGVVTVNLAAQTTGTATTATWTSGVASFTFPTPLPSSAVVGALMTTTGFTPAAYNVTNALITSVNTTSGVITIALPSQTLGTATAASWAGGVTSYTFATPLPSFVVVGAQLSTSGFTPTTYNVLGATITSVNTTTGVVTIAQAAQALTGNATAASWAGGVLSFTFATPLPSLAVVGAGLTTTNFLPGGYNVTNATITSVNTTTGVITVALATNPGTVTRRRSGTVNPGASTARGSGSANPAAATTFSTATITPPTSTTNGTATVPTGYTYTELVTNNSSSATVTSGTITVYLQSPANTIFESSAGTNWTCTSPAVGGTGPIICTYNTTLASGASASPLTLGFQIPSGTVPGTTIQSSATVTNSTFVDTTPSNNTSLSSIFVEPANASDLGVSMSVSPTPVFVSSTLTYSIQVQNYGQAKVSPTANVLTDTLPAGVTFASIVVPAGWSCTTPAVGSTGTVSCSVTSAMPATPASGSTATIAVSVNAPATATTLNNTATASLAGDPNSANNSATSYTVVQPLACATPGRDGAGGTLTGIVNTYYPGTTANLASASNSVTLGAAQGATTPIASGDLLLIIQMQDATINSTNTSSYGDNIPGDPASGSTSLGSSGLFEFVTATGSVPLAGGTLTFTGTGPTGGLLNAYFHLAASSVGTTFTAQQTYQVIRVPQYSSATLSSGLVPLAWNGTVGGVLVLDVSSQLTLGGTVSLDGLGFRGGGAQALNGPSAGGTNSPTDYVTRAPASATATAGANSSKGEGIVGTPRFLAPTAVTTTSTPTDAYGGSLTDSLPSGSYARGAPGNAGGGGTDGNPPANDQNSGGGAGSNGGAGGQGGYGWNSMAATNTTDGGFGGVPFPASTSALVMGGGGGAGTTNNGTYCNYNSGTGTCTVSGNGTGIYSSGGVGGGIIIVHSGSVVGSGTITANGQNTLSTLNDSTGGGGAGGSILVFSNSGTLSGLTVSANGGNAGYAWPTQAPGGFPGERHGPGGGGGGGVIFLTATPAGASVNGGFNGYTDTVRDSYGATVGSPGVVATAHVITETPGTQSGAYCASADLVVTNVGAPSVVAPGGTVTYTQVVTNNGPLDAVNAVFSETIPANTTFQSLPGVSGWICSTPAVGSSGTITCTNPDIPKNGSSTFTLNVTVNASAASGTQIVDVANVVSGTTDPNLTNNSATSIVTVAAATSSDLQVVNTPSSPTTIAGTNVTMTALVTNNGPAAAAGLVFTEDTASNYPSGTVKATFVSLVPPMGWSCSTPPIGGTGTITCTASTLGAGGNASFPVVLNVPAAAPVGTLLSGTANIASTTPDPNTGNNISTATTVVASTGQSDLAVSSSAVPNPVTQGNNITYTQTVTNNGPAAATAATFTDTIPAGTTLVSFTPPPANWTCGSVPPVGGTGTISCTLNPFQNIPVNGTVSFPLVVNVSLSTPAGTTVTNTANINVPCSAVSDPNCGNNSASTNLVVASPTQADLSIVKTAAPEPVTMNTNLTYTLVVSNNGPAVAQNVTVSDNIPSTTSYLSTYTPQGSCTTSTINVTTPYPSTVQVNCSLGSIGVGAQVVITVNVSASTFSSSSLTTNTATVSGSTSDPNSGNNSSSAISTIQASTAVSLSSFNAYRLANGTVLLEWHTHEESRNLGFHVYREDGSGRHRVDASLIVGSALLFRGSRPQHAAKTYRWIDANPAPDAVYWIEDLDINGTRTLHGPVSVQSAALAPAAAEISTASAASRVAAQLRAASRNAVPPSPRLITPRPGFPVRSPNAPLFAVADHSAVKIGVNQEGWYSVPLSQLVAAGLDPNVDPRSLRLFAEGVEQPILLSGNFSGRNSSGAIEFYGTGIDTPYSGTRIYWLVPNNGSGRQILTAPATNTGAPAPSSFPFTVVREDRVTYFAALLNGEDNDNFFGPIVTSDPVDQDLTIAHIDSSSSESISLDVALQGVTDAQEHRVSVQFNGSTIGELDFYGMIPALQTFPIAASLLTDGVNTVTLTALEGDNDVSVVKSVAIHYPHTYAADGDWLRAVAPAGSSLQLTGFSNPQIRAFDITDPLNITELSGKASAVNGSYQFALNLTFSGPQQRTILAFAADAVSSPASLAPHTPTFLNDLHSGGDIVMIAHPDFVASLAPLVRLRESQGHTVQLVTTDQIFDEYNYGERSPYAVRTFLQHAVAHWSNKLQSVLLVGDASFDPRDYLGFGPSDFVPSRMIETAAFKTASDDWFTDFQQAGFATIATGRLPVRTAADADLVVSKIVNYEQRTSAGIWNSQALFIADQNSDTNFSNAAVVAAANLPAAISSNHIFTDGLDTSTARSQIISALNAGSLLVNYDGHGAEQQWSFADLFDNNDAQALTNGGHLPVYVLMDCLNGFFQDVYAQSLAESILLAPEGGGVAVWASSGFTDQPPQATMNQAFLRQFQLHPGDPLGKLILDAKSGTTDSDVRRTWVLLGDPAMKLQVRASTTQPGGPSRPRLAPIGPAPGRRCLGNLPCAQERTPR